MTRTKLIAVLCSVTATVATAVLVGAAASHADVRSRAGTIVHFAGFPPAGVKASRPTTGRFLLRLGQGNATWSVYADGRIIWQKWTPSGDATVVPKGASRFDTGYVQQLLSSGDDIAASRSVWVNFSNSDAYAEALADGARGGYAILGGRGQFPIAYEWERLVKAYVAKAYPEMKLDAVVQESGATAGR